MRNFLRQHSENSLVCYPAYTSFSTKSGYGNHDTIRIYLQNSKRGRDLRKFNPSEQEIVFERNMSFRVLNAIQKNGIYRILVEEADGI